MGVVYPQKAEDIPSFFEQFVLFRKDVLDDGALDVSVVFMAAKEGKPSSAVPVLISFDLLVYEHSRGMVKEWEHFSVEQFLRRVHERHYQYHTAYHRSSEEWKVLSQIYEQAQQSIANLDNLL